MPLNIPIALNLCILFIFPFSILNICSEALEPSSPAPSMSGTIRSTTPVSATPCGNGYFKCDNGECVPRHWRCDGDPDCMDGSDEGSCDAASALARPVPARAVSCKSNEFACTVINGTARHCLPLSKVCDGQKNECQADADEGPGCLTACQNNGQCSHVCNALPTGARCSCPDRFELLDGKMCIDMTECDLKITPSIQGPCIQTCANITHGALADKCGCTSSVIMAKDDAPSKHANEALILFGAESKLSWMYPDGSHQGSIIRGSESFLTVGIEYLEILNRSISIFYTDPDSDAIIQMDLQTRQKQTIVGNLSYPEGITLDWVAQNLYYVDSGGRSGEIGVCSLHTQTVYCNTVIQGLANPRGIAVHPTEKMLFFTQWGTNGSIDRTWLDGSGRMAIVRDHVVWPNAITVDFIHDHLYWIDAKLNWIETAKLDGRDRRTVLNIAKSHPFGLSILADRLFWTDWTTKSLRSSSINGSNPVTVRALHTRPMGVIVMHKSRRPVDQKMMSDCNAGLKNPCDHICLGRPGQAATCKCHAGYELDGTGHCNIYSLAWNSVARSPPRVIAFKEIPTITCAPSNLGAQSPSNGVATNQSSRAVLVTITCAVLFSTAAVVLMVFVVRKYVLLRRNPQVVLVMNEYLPVTQRQVVHAWKF